MRRLEEAAEKKTNWPSPVASGSGISRVQLRPFGHLDHAPLDDADGALAGEPEARPREPAPSLLVLGLRRRSTGVPAAASAALGARQVRGQERVVLRPDGAGAGPRRQAPRREPARWRRHREPARRRCRCRLRRRAPRRRHVPVVGFRGGRLGGGDSDWLPREDHGGGRWLQHGR